jgi:cytosine/adenosine deaminase-related metal-dependent hydrolase
METTARYWFDGFVLRTSGVKVVDAVGRIAKVTPLSLKESENAPSICLTPGFVNAHAHLELSALQGLLGQGLPFYDWLSRMRSLVAPWTLADYQKSYLQGLRESAKYGTRTLYDVGNQMAEPPKESLEGERLGVRLFAMHEVIKEMLPPPVTPHSLYATPPGLVLACVRQCVAQGIPWSLHLAEHSQDRTLGELLEILEGLGGDLGSGILAHGNLLTESDLKIVRQKNWLVVHCPESCAWFGHQGPDWELWRRTGVKVAIGTDSLASARSLDLREQVKALLRRTPGAMSLEEAFAGITSVPGEFLGGGRIAVGERADFLSWAVPEGTPRERVLEAVLNC